MASGNNRYGCYLLAVTIFGLGIFRDVLYVISGVALLTVRYERALSEQPVLPLLADSPFTIPIAVALFVGGNTLVLTSMYALGVTGTYLGDYFGILMDSMVTGFPFNVTSCPMYLGSTMSFLGTALWFGKPAGILLTAWVWILYSGALGWEDEFTGKIYRERDEKALKKQ
jgi:phosphatidylethanolamine/phosphatidyl-N-methylethanolamine N-methyltransferase